MIDSVPVGNAQALTAPLKRKAPRLAIFLQHLHFFQEGNIERHLIQLLDQGIQLPEYKARMGIGEV